MLHLRLLMMDASFVRNALCHCSEFALAEACLANGMHSNVRVKCENEYRIDVLLMII